MTYQRNQVTWTVARCITPDPSPDFERDVALKLQRLIDSDRAMVLDAPSGMYAFLGNELPGTGSVVHFSEEAAFLLLLGNLLLESGLTQSRVVRLLRGLKDGLCRQYRWILSFPPADLRGGRNDAAWRRDLKRGQVATSPAHLTFLVASGNLADPDGAVDHRLCRNRDQLLTALTELSLDPRPVIAVELTNRAWAVWHWLPQAPVITRGRRPAK